MLANIGNRKEKMNLNKNNQQKTNKQLSYSAVIELDAANAAIPANDNINVNTP